MLLQSLSIFGRHSKGLAEQFQEEKRMSSPLDAVVLVQFLGGPSLPLSATIGFEEGEVTLERDLQTSTFFELPKSPFACRSIDSSISLREAAMSRRY